MSDLKIQAFIHFMNTQVPWASDEDIDRHFPQPDPQDKTFTVSASFMQANAVTGKVLSDFIDRELVYTSYQDIERSFPYPQINRYQINVADEPAVPAPAATDKKDKERPTLPGYNLAGKLMLFSKNEKNAALAGKKFLIYRDLQEQGGVHALCLNAKIPNVPFFGSYVQNTAEPCHARGKLIRMSQGGGNRLPSLTIVTDRDGIEKPPVKDENISFGSVYISQSQLFYDKAREGELDTQRTIMVSGYTAFSNQQMADFIRNPHCMMIDADPEMVFSKNTAEMLIESARLMGEAEPNAPTASLH